MNYQKVYNQLVERGRIRILSGYKERHHILPKCLGGKDSNSNLTYLTAREHFLCHWLLHRIYPKNSKLTYAFWMMCLAVNKEVQPRHRPSSRAYEEVRKHVVELKKGVPKSKSSIDKRSAKRKGVPRKEETKKKLSQAHTGKKKSEETKQKMRQSRLEYNKKKLDN